MTLYSVSRSIGSRPAARIRRAIARGVEIINAFPEQYERNWLAGMRAKLGLNGEGEADRDLATGFLAIMQGKNIDWTLAFRVDRQ